MKKLSRIFLFGALTLILLTAACAGQEGSPTAVGTTIPGDETASPPPIETDTTGTVETATISTEATLDTTATVDLSATAPAATDTTQIAATDTTQTPGVPVTGVDLILLECQYCIDGMAHALLVLPDTATFETVADTASVSTPDTGCNTVDTFNGRQTVICRAEENTSLNLNICTDGNNCTQLLVELQPCPDTGTAQPGPTNTPGVGDPTNTAVVGATDTPSVSVTDTPSVGSPTATP
jgi:hypothetical protein